MATSAWPSVGAGEWPPGRTRASASSARGVDPIHRNRLEGGQVASAFLIQPRFSTPPSGPRIPYTSARQLGIQFPLMNPYLQPLHDNILTPSGDGAVICIPAPNTRVEPTKPMSPNILTACVYWLFMVPVNRTIYVYLTVAGRNIITKIDALRTSKKTTFGNIPAQQHLQVPIWAALNTSELIVHKIYVKPTHRPFVLRKKVRLGANFSAYYINQQRWCHD